MKGSGNENKSPCETCEKQVCPGEGLKVDWYTKAYALAGDAEHGPAQGTPRQVLLQRLLTCMHRTECVQILNEYDSPVTAVIEAAYQLLFQCDTRVCAQQCVPGETAKCVGGGAGCTPRATN